jgi:hypothetical protein
MCVLLGPDPGRDEWLTDTPREDDALTSEDLPFSDADMSDVDMTLEHVPF